MVAWARQQSWFTEPLMMIGHSLGGYSALRYALDHPNEVKKVIAGAPFLSGLVSFAEREVHNPRSLLAWAESGWSISVDRRGNTRKLLWSHMADRLKHDLISRASELQTKTLLFVGDKDKSTGAASRLFSLWAPKDYFTLVRDPDLGHTIDIEDKDRIQKQVLEWLRSS